MDSANKSNEMTSESKKLIVCNQQGGKLERLAGWVGASLASAFFASLERCSCVTLNTIDADEDEEANDRPLIPINREPVHHERCIKSQTTKRRQIGEDDETISA